jgi:hypothetical protein
MQIKYIYLTYTKILLIFVHSIFNNKETWIILQAIFQNAHTWVGQ